MAVNFIYPLDLDAPYYEALGKVAARGALLEPVGKPYTPERIEDTASAIRVLQKRILRLLERLDPERQTTQTSAISVLSASKLPLHTLVKRQDPAR